MNFQAITSEFDLHARAILNLPIAEIKILRPGACHTINAEQASDDYAIIGLAEIEGVRGVEAMLFGKPDAYPNRRLGIIFAPDVETAIAARAKISISY